MKNLKLLLALLIALYPTDSGAKNLTVCVDSSWFPYTFVKENRATGIHVDIVKKALENMGTTADFIPLPWKRCLRRGERGEVDAVMSASYSDTRAAFAYYPDDAKTSKKSKGRISQVEQVLLTRKTDPYEFDGDWATIPEPVGVMDLGSSITKALNKKGIETIEGYTKKAGLKMLTMKRVNSLTLNHMQAEHFRRAGEFKDELKINKVPLRSKSYQIIFSKKSPLSQKDREAIWSRLSNVREDKKFMLGLIRKYTKEN